MRIELDQGDKVVAAIPIPDSSAIMVLTERGVAYKLRYSFGPFSSTQSLDLERL